MGLLIKTPHPQLWVLSSPIDIPLHLLAVHCWIVTKDRLGIINRWEVWHRPSVCKTSWGHVHQNLFPPETGIIKLPFFLKGKATWPASLIGHLDGDQAEFLGGFLLSKAKDYPEKDHYRYLGPNSNSFVQWVLNQLPEAQIRLPKKALGKNYFQ
ncbi:MAG: DUF3750 domain-containing protein [Deltaproteobacteria bacterium]|nr:DUF3750 domain-containing protein [Deltaproteobacteria bacterium]